MKNTTVKKKKIPRRNILILNCDSGLLENKVRRFSAEVQLVVLSQNSTRRAPPSRIQDFLLTLVIFHRKFQVIVMLIFNSEINFKDAFSCSTSEEMNWDQK